MGSELPSLSDLFAEETHRLRGLTGWEDLPELGSRNLERLLFLARERATAALHQGDLDEVRARAAGLRRLEALASGSAAPRPMLPRIRAESFRVGDEVALYLGDSPGALARGWVRARVTRLAKSHKPEWVSAQANSGYFWEVTAEAERPLFPGLRAARFSTTEPRALALSDLAALRELASAAPGYFRVFAENAWRDWHPLWCLDRGESIDPSGVDFARWLREAPLLA